MPSRIIRITQKCSRQHRIHTYSGGIDGDNQQNRRYSDANVIILIRHAYLVYSRPATVQQLTATEDSSRRTDRDDEDESFSSLPTWKPTAASDAATRRTTRSRPSFSEDDRDWYRKLAINGLAWSSRLPSRIISDVQAHRLCFVSALFVNLVFNRVP